MISAFVQRPTDKSGSGCGVGITITVILIFSYWLFQFISSSVAEPSPTYEILVTGKSVTCTTIYNNGLLNGGGGYYTVPGTVCQEPESGSVKARYLEYKFTFTLEGVSYECETSEGAWNVLESGMRFKTPGTYCSYYLDGSLMLGQIAR